MTENQEPAKASTPGANRGVKKGLPESGLPTAEAAARKLWDVARLGRTTQDAFAAQWGPTNKASGGAWRRRMALLRGFGLVTVDGDQIGLSKLGQQLVNDADYDNQMLARQKAVTTLKSYSELINAFDNTELPDPATLASRLKYDYGKTDAAAQSAAQAFIDSIKHANMLDDSNYVRKAGAQTNSSEAQESDALDVDEAHAEEIDLAFGSDEPDDVLADDEQKEQADGSVGISTSASVSLAMSLDLSKYRADEVIQIVKALGLTRRG